MISERLKRVRTMSCVKIAFKHNDIMSWLSDVRKKNKCTADKALWVISKVTCVFQWFTENSSVNYNTMHFYLQFWGIFTPLIRALISLAELFPILQWSSGLSCFSLRHTKANEREIVDCVEISSTAIVSSFILSCPLTTIWIRFETKI